MLRLKIQLEKFCSNKKDCSDKIIARTTGASKARFAICKSRDTCSLKSDFKVKVKIEPWRLK